MKLVRTQENDYLQLEIRQRFAEFNSSHPLTPGRRYPKDLKELICNASANGLKLHVLCRLTGISKGVIKQWLSLGVPAAAAPRRIAVVEASPLVTKASLIIIRLPSQVTIELVDCQSLTSGLLSALCAIEVRDAASR